jgi:cytoskeleton protein RodZ
MTETAADDTPGAAMPRSPGAILAAERERQGLARADIAQRLHMSVSQIEALESADYDRLPRGPFLRGFTRNYARTLGLDAEALVALVAETAPREVAPRIIVPSQNIRFDPLGVRLANPYVKAAGIAAAIIVLGFAAMYWWLFIRQHGVTTTAAKSGSAEVAKSDNDSVALSPPPVPGPDASVAPATEPAPSADPAAQASPGTTVQTIQIPPQAAANAVAEPAASATNAVAARGDGVIRLAFKAAAWVEIVDASGRSIISRTHAAGSSSDVVGKPPFNVVIGNAPEVRLAYNGRDVDLGPHTRASVARFTLQ